MARTITKRETENVEASQKEVSPKRIIDSNTPVDVMNNTTGRLVFTNNRTQAKWAFDGYGAMDEMLVSDLKNMRSSSPSLLLESYLLILDDDVIEHLRLQKVYENIIKPEDIDNFFKQNDVKMREILDKCPKGMKEVLFMKAKEMIINNHPDMDYNSKKRVFEDIFNIKFEDIIR
jgi:hypothetical protein